MVLDWLVWRPVCRRPTFEEVAVAGLAGVAMGGSRWAATIAVAVRALPLILVVIALVPALVVCPFLGTDHRSWLLSLVGALRAWAIAPGDAFAPRESGP